MEGKRGQILNAARWRFAAVILLCQLPAFGSDVKPAPPRVFIAEPETLLRMRGIIQQQDDEYPLFREAMDSLRREADKALKAGPFSVTFKTRLPPSKDKHDYLSLGIYWWPNPDAPDGLPYVRRDGQANPEFQQDAYDASSFLELQQSVRILSLAWYYTGDKTYAEHAASLLRTWFLEADTLVTLRMIKLIRERRKVIL